MGTVYLRARYYNPSTGRFISRDSFAGRRSDSLSLNLYTYCRNNPLRYVDLSGRFFKDLTKSISSVVESAGKKIESFVNSKKIEDTVSKVGKMVVASASAAMSIASSALGYKNGECSYRVTADQLAQMGFNQGAVSSVRNLNIVLDKYNITSTNEISHFLAQCAYEGDWGNGLIEYDNEEKTYLKSRSYWPYYGAGYIQISTASNYEAFSKDMNDPLIYNGEGSPEYVAVNYAWEAAAWWWDNADMNQKINEGYTVDQVSGTIIAWNKDAPDNGSYSKRRQNHAMIYGVLE